MRSPVVADTPLLFVFCLKKQKPRRDKGMPCLYGLNNKINRNKKTLPPFKANRSHTHNAI
jgi:hypothetical protein